ncbi:aspartyl protease APCB1-like isoform X2 [Phragmites australis]|uniref:aspartyl protease APCB1-like isoform X2 n=1 Tax=Phragmites australis TaxID=29695 RepID=UPI002D7754B7|nr:aspartyl protease APCB1-like isoform X2 [Phragmites australis]
MTWVPIRNGPNNIYSTEVQKVNYGDQHRSVQGQSGKLTRVIFDSGSTYTYFPREAYTNLIAVVQPEWIFFSIFLSANCLKRNCTCLNFTVVKWPDANC